MTDTKIPRLGIMDSGLGGLSLLADMLHFSIPWEIVYYADFNNLPYGNKSKSEVKILVENSVSTLIEKGCQAVILACNTATSVAVDDLRNNHDLPIFGMEPAIKPALNAYPDEKIAVLATQLTLKEDRFLSLKNRVDPMNRVIPIACPGLADIIEREEWTQAENYLIEIFSKPEMDEIHSIVLGCTHYVFLESMISRLRKNIKIFHGNAGTIRHIFKSLSFSEKKNNSDSNIKPNHSIIYISNSGEDYSNKALSFLEKRYKMVY
ncbi:MAG: glutamate racemase [Leptospira sp.]|nr:glutamate racemase [Leptospira sp.]